MGKDDPFDLHAQNDDTTVVIRPIRPQPGGPRQARQAEPAPPLPPRPPLDAGDHSLPPKALPPSGRVGENPLLSAAVPILSLAPLLRSPSPPTDPESLRDRLLEELGRYREAAHVADADRTAAEQAAWALAALLDDAVLNTPWGMASGWAGRGLVSTVWGDVDAGERFFERLAEMQQEPGRHAPVLEVFHRCLAMGFEGRYRVAGAGAGRVEDVRRGVARVLAGLAGPLDPTLSPHWRGVAVAPRPPVTLVPPWVIGTAAVALLLVLFTGLRFRLADHTTEQLGAVAADLPPAARPVTIRRDRPSEAPPVPVPVPDPTPIPGFLAEEQRQGLVTVAETTQRVLIRLTAADLFVPGSERLAADHRALVDKIGEALATRPGRILVVGHTDDVPLRRNLRFASNRELSEARAANVAGLLAARLPPGRQLESDGRGERDPIAGNATEDGRARNRRVEIMLLKEEAEG